MYEPPSQIVASSPAFAIGPDDIVRVKQSVSETEHGETGSASRHNEMDVPYSDGSGV
jgi:hypothetical protein